MQIFDAVINLKASYCVKAYQKIDICQGTFLPHLGKENGTKTNDENIYPIVDFDPVEIYVKHLTNAYGDLAYFFHDIYGDTKVYVLWKQASLIKSKEFLTQHLGFCSFEPTNSSLELNIEAIIDDFKIMGNELVESVSFKTESSIFK